MPMTFDEFMERYNAQGGPLPSAWSPEAQQAYAEKQNTMGIAEVRPKNVTSLTDYLVKQRAKKAEQQSLEMNKFRNKNDPKLSPEDLEYQRGLDAGDYIPHVNINQFEEVSGSPYMGKGQEFSYDGQRYKVIGNVGDLVEIRPIDHPPENMIKLEDYLRMKGKK